MRSMLLPLGALLTIAAAPPPPIAVASVPPPIFNPVPVEEINRLPPVPIKVGVYLGRETLWTGTLSVGSSPARLSLNEAVDMPSSCDVSGYRGKSRTIELTLTRQIYRDKDNFALTARYSRPSPAGICPIGSRQVSVEQTLQLPSGGVTVEGDGGFRITLTR